MENTLARGEGRANLEEEKESRGFAGGTSTSLIQRRLADPVMPRCNALRGFIHEKHGIAEIGLK